MNDELSKQWQSKTAHEGFQPTQSARFDAVANTRPVDVAPDDARVLKYLQMLGHGRLRERQFFDDIPANAAISSDQNPDDFYAHRMAQGFAVTRQLFVGFIAFDRAQIRLIVCGRAAPLGGLRVRFHRK
jgi:hypothetical protein